MADLDPLRELMVYLIAQGIAEHADTKSYALPSIWLMPRDGAALPRTTAETATITLNDTLLRSPSTLEPWMQESFIDVIVRSRQPTAGKLIQRTITGLIAPFDQIGGRRQWMMGALLVETSDQWRGDQPLPQRQDVAAGDPHLTYDRVASYRFMCRRKVLAGLTMP